MKNIKIIFAVFVLLLYTNTTADAQVKQSWEIADLVSIDGKILKTFKVNTSTYFVDSILIVSCSDFKVLSLLSNPTQSLFDDTDYRVYKGDHIITHSDSLGIIDRRPYHNILYNNKIVVFVDDSLSFVMIHPNPQIAIVFHNKLKNNK